MCYNKPVEHKNIIKSLDTYKNFVKDFMSGKLVQAYLFICEDALTCDLLTCEIAKLLACDVSNGCEICPSCKKINANSHPDVLMYPKGKNFVVEDANDIYGKVQVKPMFSKFKIFVLNNFDKATEQAQNKMLKIIEEPPANVIFLLSAGSESNVLHTITSRVQKNI